MEEKQYVVDSLSFEEPWRVFRIMAEFVDAIEVLSKVHNMVTIFGSARVTPNDIYYQKAERLAQLLVKNGFGVITGGGPGIMEAANKGAGEAGGQSVGMNIRLPFEQKPNPYANIHIDYKYFFIRKVMFVKYAVAYVILPGGFGTMDELFEALTLIQTKRIKSFPLFLMGRDYWQGLLDWLKKTMLAEGKILPADLELIQVIDEPEEVVKHIKKYVIILIQQLSLMALEKVFTDLNKGILAPCYLLYGEEEYLVSEALRKILDLIIPSADRDFGLFPLDDENADIDQIQKSSFNSFATWGPKVVVVQNTTIFHSRENLADLIQKIRVNIDEQPARAVKYFLTFM